MMDLELPDVIENVLDSYKERKMRKAFDKESNEILENREDFAKDYDAIKVGLEVEYSIQDGDEPASAEKRNELIDPFEFMDIEFGASQAELVLEPNSVSSLDDLGKLLDLKENQVRERADDLGLDLLRIGTNPFLDPDKIKRTDKPKYEIVPDFHDERRNGHVPDIFGIKDTINPKDADYAGAINATQVNIEADNLGDAVEKANFTYMISPFISAFSGNSRFLGELDLGVSDSRMPIWEMSHDIRTAEDVQEGESVRVGVIDEYYNSIEEYFEAVREEPFIMHEKDEALDIGIGTSWKDARIKFNNEPEDDIYDTIVESRVASTQPTIEEEIAVHGFYIGRLAYAQVEDESLMDIERVNRNRYTAMFNGLDEKLYSTEGEHKDAAEVLREELQKAEQGLEYAGIESDGYLELLSDRLDTGTPSDQMAEGFYEALENGSDRRDALKQGLENQRGGLENTTDAK
jgi:gamma-glutamylcysteine synthetase